MCRARREVGVSAAIYHGSSVTSLLARETNDLSISILKGYRDVSPLSPVATSMKHTFHVDPSAVRGYAFGSGGNVSFGCFDS